MQVKCSRLNRRRHRVSVQAVFVSLALKVLGSSGGYPVRGLPCSGYLVTADQENILLDCGPGIATALLADGRHCGLDGVVISHLHPDHVLDLVPLAYALLAEWLVDGRTAPLPLCIPQGGLQFLQRFSDLFGHRNWQFPSDVDEPGKRALAASVQERHDWLLTVFDVREYAIGDTLRLGANLIETHAVDHNAPTAAMRIEKDGARIVYSADARFDPTLVGFAASADLFLVDAHMSGPLAGGAHMSPAEAGRLAALAGVRELVLCHLAAPEDGPSARATAAQHFNGAIHLAFETREYRL